MTATATDATPDALGYVQLTGLDTFTARAIPVVQQGKILPELAPRSLMLRPQHGWVVLAFRGRGGTVSCEQVAP